MNRDQYFDRHRNLNIEREMLERKWRAFQEEQQLQEQMMMFEAARAAQSAAAVASGAGGSFEEVLPPYCGGNKQIITYTAFFANILKPGIDRFAPSYSDFDNYVHDEIKDLAARVYRDSYLKSENENKNSLFDYKKPAIEPLPSPVPASTIFYRLDLPQETNISWYCKNVDQYQEWIDSGASVEMPEVKELRTLNAVQTSGELPGTGNPGDVIYVIGEGNWYAWNKNSNNWDSGYYDTYIVSTKNVMRIQRDSHVKSKYEVISALNPFLFAAKYIPEYKIYK